MEKEIRNMNVKELKALAKERGIKRYYWLRKAQLIESLETETPPTEAPETEIMEAPETEIMEAPETEIMEAPETEIMEAPETEITEAPETEIMEAPVPEIKKPVLSPTKMENISTVSSLVGLAKKQADLVQKAINKFADWLINYIPAPIRRTVNTRVEKLKKQIKEILENKKKLSRQEVNISQEEYQNFCDEFHKRGCVTMKDWLKEYNLADVEPFIEALEKTREQYYPDEIDLLKDAVSIPGISMTYVLNKALKRKKYSEPDLFAPGEPCKCECSSDDCQKKGCEKCKEIRDNCKICTKNEAYEMLTTGMIGGPSIVFCRHAEAGVSKIRSHIYREEDAKTCRSVQGLDANSLYLFCSGQEMPCGKEKVFHCDTEEKNEIIQNVLNDKLFGFFEVDIEVPEQKRKRFSEFCPLFVISEVPEDQIPQHMKDYKINTGRKMIKNNKKLLGVMKTEKILIYSPLLKWYLNHGLQVTKIHRYISYISGRPFKWFPEEVSSARREADNDKNKKQLGDTAKLKGNSFYGKMIENLEKHISTKFTTDEKLIDEIFRSPFFEDLEEINEGVFEVRQRKRKVTITRPYQCGIAVYQLAKLRMLEFYYDFLDKFCDRRDFELIQMDTDSFYMALSANDFDEIIKPEMKELYKEEKKNWLVTDEYSKRVPGLFKAEFQGKRMIALTSKCYFADSGKDEGVKKFSCKGVSRRQNKMNWERYKNALFGSLDKARNIGFRKRDNHIVTYEQSKLGLSAYYDKRIVHEDGIHTSCL